MKTILIAAMLIGFSSNTLHAQSLAEAAEKAAAIKAARVAKGEWVPVASTATPETVPVPPVTVPVLDSTPVTVDTKTVEPGTEAKNRIAAVALLGDRLVALRSVLVDRGQNTAKYRDACVGKVTSAGFRIRGILVTTPNEDTPACQVIASDLLHQTTAFDLEHKAIAETARTSGVFPGVLRDLFASNGLPE